MSELPSIDRLRWMRESVAPPTGRTGLVHVEASELLSLLGCAIALRTLEAKMHANPWRDWRIVSSGKVIAVHESGSEEQRAPTLLAALVRALDQAEGKRQ